MLGRLRHHYRRSSALACALAALLAVSTSSPELPLLDGDFFDLAAAARAGFGPVPKPDEPVAVVAIDQATLQAPEFAELPRVFFGPFLGEALTGLFKSQVRAAGIDIVFGYSPDRFPGVGRNYDLGFRRAIGRNRPNLVLVRTHHLRPAPEIIASAFDPDEDTDNGDPKVFAFSELFPDSDGIVRRFPATLPVTDMDHAPPTLAAALLARAGTAMPAEILVAPQRKLEAIPAYSLSDVLNCARKDKAALRRTLPARSS